MFEVASFEVVTLMSQLRDFPMGPKLVGLRIVERGSRGQIFGETAYFWESCVFGSEIA